MDEDQKRKRDTERKLDADIARLTRIADECAARYMVSSDHAEECSSEFVTSKIMQWLKEDPAGELCTDEELLAECSEHAKSYGSRRRTRRRKEQLFSETPGIELVASHDPGPEEIVQCAALLRRLLKPVPRLIPVQQRIFVQAILQEQRLVDISPETGRSADALGKAIRRILDRLRKFLEGELFDDGEIEDYRSLLDQMRNVE